jgi:hypothetical protein
MKRSWLAFLVFLLAGAGMLLQTLMALQAARPGFETARVLAVNVPVTSYGRTPEQIRGFYREVQRRVGSVPGVRYDRWHGSADCLACWPTSDGCCGQRESGLTSGVCLCYHLGHGA